MFMFQYHNLLRHYRTIADQKCLAPEDRRMGKKMKKWLKHKL